MSGPRHHAGMPKSKPRARANRKARARASSSRWSLVAHEGPPPGRQVVSASLSEVLAAFEAVPDELDWPSLRDRVLPILPRLRPLPPGAPEPLRTIVAPGVSVGFGVDIGPAFMSVTAELVDRWAVSIGDLTATALVNLHARAAEVSSGDIHHGSIDGVPTAWLQTGRSVGSTLVLAPAELTRLFGPEPTLLIAPMRDLVIGLPAGVDRELAAWLFAEVASEDPNCLIPMAFLVDAGRITPQPLGPPLAALSMSSFGRFPAA